jgi:branched-chain amino acid transport system substrate-binding protein
VGRRSWHAVGMALVFGAAACDDGGISVDPGPVSTSTTQPSQERETDGVYRLGVLLPRSGNGEVLGDALVAGASLATQAISQAGGVAGLPLEVVTREEPSDPAEAIDVVEELIETERIDALVGPASTRNALAVLEVIVSNGLLTCSPTATAIELSDFADSGYFVRTIGSDRLMARAMAGAIDSLGITRAAIVFPYDDYGVDVADTLRRDLDSRDISDVKLVRYAIDSALPAVVDEALLDAPQAVGVIGSLPSGARVLGELRTRIQGAQIPTVVSDGLRSPEVATIIDPSNRTVIDGVTGVSPASAPVAWLATQLREQNPEAPIAYSAHAFDCVNLLALAAESAGSDDPSRARAEIVDVSRGGVPCSTFVNCRDEVARSRNIDYNGASGALELNDQGDVTVAAYDLFEYVDGLDVRSETLLARL